MAKEVRARRMTKRQRAAFVRRVEKRTGVKVFGPGERGYQEAPTTPGLIPQIPGCSGKCRHISAAVAKREFSRM